MHSTGAFDYTANRARQEAEKAVEALAPIAESDFKQALIALAGIAASRRS
jgi:octaprenyl-diphosphate synthase